MNFGRFAFLHTGGSNTIDNLRITVARPVPVDWLFVGDSITSGMRALGQEQSWTECAARRIYGNSVMFAESGAVSADVCRAWPWLTNVYQPKNIVFMLGGNDWFFSVPADTFASNYVWLNTNSTAHNVINCFPTARSAALGLTNLVECLRTNTPVSSQVDLFTATVDTVGKLYEGYDPGDHIHPNSQGHSVMGAVLADYLAQWPTNRARLW